jgi:hypothetical protein
LNNWIAPGEWVDLPGVLSSFVQSTSLKCMDKF